MKSRVDTSMTTILGSRELAKQAYDAILKLKEIERRDKAAAGGQSVAHEPSAEAIEQRLAIEKLLLATPSMASSAIATGRYERWRIHMDAKRSSSAVISEAKAWQADPILYQQRKLMEAYQSAFSRARVKFVLSIDPSRVRFEIDNQEGDAGLNFADSVSGDSKK